MMLFSLLFEIYPDGVWELKSPLSLKNGVVICDFLFQGTNIFNKSVGVMFKQVKAKTKSFRIAPGEEEDCKPYSKQTSHTSHTSHSSTDSGKSGSRKIKSEKGKSGKFGWWYLMTVMFVAFAIIFYPVNLSHHIIAFHKISPQKHTSRTIHWSPYLDYSIASTIFATCASIHSFLTTSFPSSQAPTRRVAEREQAKALLGRPQWISPSTPWRWSEA
jgi:hypothetical protein